MNINDTPDEAIFRIEARAFLDANAKRRVPGAAPSRTADRDDAVIQAAKSWQQKKAQCGFAAITWPKTVGGRGGTPIQQIIYAQEEAQFVTPPGIFDIGLGMCIPTLIKHGSKDHAARHVMPALLGQEIWCQLFSEPAAGSDVAGIRTRAIRDGDNWVINGQKVWTTGAHFSDFGLLLVRTDPDVPKHKGLTMFFLDMRSKGVEARPIKQVSGGAEFNEVFFTDVRIPDSQRLGNIGDGWTVALTTLMNERLAVGIDIDGDAAIRHGAIRDRLANFYIDAEGLKYTRYRMWTALSRGQTPGPQSSINKVVSGRMMQDLGTLAMEVMGESALIDGEGPGNGAFQRQWLGAAGFRIAGGTDEILRNIIAERVLGMPPDVRVDKDGTFNELEKTAATARAKRK
jgi:alkylation response protein AidB-like acyl-CoA dehydrogenase